VLATVATSITIGAYGLVAGIVKLNDPDLHLVQKTNASAQKLGRGLLVFAPRLMRGLSVFSTLAMFMVEVASSPTTLLFFIISVKSSWIS